MALVEVEASRSEQQHALSIGAVRAFECLLTELTQGAGGWTGNGITIVAKGDAYGLGTWTGKVEPRCHTVNVTPHSPSLDKARIVAYYAAPRIFGG
jgi:hypothetical protein